MSATADLGSEQHRSEGKHLDLISLKQELRREQTFSKYIEKDIILTYPRPELHVSHLSHSTDLKGLKSICRDRGLQIQRSPLDNEPKVQWFSLTVSPEELREAETREMILVHPGGVEEVVRPQKRPQRILQNFASSPAFKSSSRYGSFRFTFSLKNVLDKYRQQFCAGQEPILRVFRTVLYKQEVMYAVLVHSPANNRIFSDYPLLGEKPHSICAFRTEPEPHFIWRPQAMCGTHRFGLEVDHGNLWCQEYDFELYYVWDHVALALHVGDELLKFEVPELRGSLRFCEADVISVPKVDPVFFQNFGEACFEVAKLWPGHRLQKFTDSHFHITR